MYEQPDHSHSSQSQANEMAGSQQKNEGQKLEPHAKDEIVDQSSKAKQAAQLKSSADQFVSKKQPIQRKNNTGLPDKLKSGVENLSGYSMDDVKVHYNSDKPAQLQAHAYAQGNQIHVAPGQEKHLPHEAWHVVQQKQGRVRPTTQLKANVNVNDDVHLEKEADVMGARALQLKTIQQNSHSDDLNLMKKPIGNSNDEPIQRAVVKTAPDVVLNKNIAVAWKGGGDYAVTPSIINGHEIPPSANKKGMILEPRLEAVAGVWRTMPETQNVGSRIDAPTVGPWTLPAQASLEELDAFAGAGGYNTPVRSALENSHTYTLIVRGSPNDATLYQALITHEMHHVAEQDAIIDEILVPWDQLVTNQNASANDPLNAGMAYDALNIPKAQTIADSIVAELGRQGRAFHATAEGMAPDIQNVVLNEAAATYTVYLKSHV